MSPFQTNYKWYVVHKKQMPSGNWLSDLPDPLTPKLTVWKTVNVYQGTSGVISRSGLDYWKLKDCCSVVQLWTERSFPDSSTFYGYGNWGSYASGGTVNSNVVYILLNWTHMNSCSNSVQVWKPEECLSVQARWRFTISCRVFLASWRIILPVHLFPVWAPSSFCHLSSVSSPPLFRSIS